MRPSRIALLLFLTFCISANAERRTVVVAEASTSGRTLLINIGTKDNLKPKDALLFRSGSTKLVAARAIKVNEHDAAVYIVERYHQRVPVKDQTYNVLYGVPLGNIPALPSDLAEADRLPTNPQDEQFFRTKEQIPWAPELLGKDYDPEPKIQPIIAEENLRSPHNFLVGVMFFRHPDLEVINASSSLADRSNRKTYAGFGIRYSYNFDVNYWLNTKYAATLGLEVGAGTYSFEYSKDNLFTNVRVWAMTFQLRHYFQLAHFLRGYPYVSITKNTVQSSADPGFDLGLLDPLSDTIFGAGAGFQMILGELTDARIEVGFDGAIAGLVFKF